MGPLVTHPARHLFQGLQLLAVYEVHLRDEVIEVFVAGVDVGLGTHHNDPVEVVDVDVDEDPEEAAQDLLADLQEVLWEGNTHTRWKDVFIVDLDLDPIHEKVHVLGGRQGSRLLVLEVILPPVFVFGAP